VTLKTKGKRPGASLLFLFFIKISALPPKLLLVCDGSEASADDKEVRPNQKKSNNLKYRFWSVRELSDVKCCFRKNYILTHYEGIFNRKPKKQRG